MLLKNRKILLGVTGSVAIYKSIELLRLLIKEQARVKTVMTPSSRKFLSPLMFEAAGSDKVLWEESEEWSGRNNHIHVAEDHEIFIIAPATANTINKLSNGIADNLLLQTALAFDKKKIVAPSMNTNMLKNPFTQASLKLLKLNGYKIMDTQFKELACKSVGEGAMAEPLQIFYETVRAALKEPFWENRIAIVTGGGTIEKIDDVRYISNFSSGKQAAALAKALYFKGARVELITTRKMDDLPAYVEQFLVKSAEDMSKVLAQRIEKAKEGVDIKPNLVNDIETPQRVRKKPYLFMAAAVSDYKPADPKSGKLKKSELGDRWLLELKKNVDILSLIDKSGIVTVGFKAETDEKEALNNAKKMLIEKELDAVCLNLVKGAASFGSDKNSIVYISKNRTVQSPLKDKLELSLDICEIAEELDEQG